MPFERPHPPAAPLRSVVVIDDSEIDVELLRLRLQDHYPDLQAVHWLRDEALVVSQVVAQVAALAPDLVISDFHIPGYDLLATLRALRQRWPTLPLLVMSGLVGEEAAVQVLKAGANDFLPKSRSERLPLVIARELAEAQASQTRAVLQGELELQRLINQALFEQVPAGLWILTPDGVIARTNPHAEQLLGGPPQPDPTGLSPLQGWWADNGQAIAPSDWPGPKALAQGQPVPPRLLRLRSQRSELRHISCGAAPLTAPDGRRLGAVVTAIDLTAEVALQVRVRDAEARLRSLSLNQNDQHERQMSQVARDLHDHLGQVLSLLKLHLGSAARADLPPARRALEIDEALPLVDLALRRLREVCSDLAPSELADFGLAPALASLCSAATRASGLAVQAGVDGTPRPLASALQLGLFRVAQAALTNALRHAGAAAVQLNLQWQDDALVLQVSDDGTGFDPQAPRAPSQQGLRGMRERMELLGGSLQVESLPGQGTRVRASVPVPAAAGAGQA